jgi:3-dehydroquinate synthase
VHFTRGLFDPANRCWSTRWPGSSRTGGTAAWSSSMTAWLEGAPGLRAIEAYAVPMPTAWRSWRPDRVPGGERIKMDLHFVEDMQRRVVEHRIDRHSYVIAIGGGAVLDAVGLVAATTHRGIRHIRVPTTVLAQNDSGVGVKNGVNLMGQKNLVGTSPRPSPCSTTSTSSTACRRATRSPAWPRR